MTEPTPDPDAADPPAEPAPPEPVPYSHSLDYVWTEKAFEFLGSGRLRAEIADAIVVVDGDCPRCEHPFAYTAITFAALVGGEPGVLGDRHVDDGPVAADEVGGPNLVLDDYLPVTVPCGCTLLHPGRAAGDKSKGCGVSFRIEVRHEGRQP